MDANMEKCPHLDPTEAQTLSEIGATEEQWIASDIAAKNRINRYQASYKHGETQMTMLVIGATGAGKSATANTILGRKAFREGSSAISVTTETQKENGVVDGLEVSVIDTPGSWQTQLGTDILLDLPAEWIVLLVINLASPRFGQNQLDELRALKGPDGTLLLNSRRCVAVLSHADGALQQISLAEYLTEIQSDPLHILLTQDLQGNILAVNNAAMTPYERQQQQRAILNAVTKASLKQLDNRCTSCCGSRCNKAGCYSFGVVAAISSSVLMAILGLLLGLYIRSPFSVHTHKYILGAFGGAAVTTGVFMLRKLIQHKPLIGLSVLGGAAALGLIVPSQYVFGAIVGCIIDGAVLFAKGQLEW